MRGAVLYRGIWLMPNSECLALYNKGELKKLDALLKELDLKEKRLRGEL